MRIEEVNECSNGSCSIAINCNRCEEANKSQRHALDAEIAGLKDELFDKDTVALMDDCKKYATENFRLNAEVSSLTDHLDLMVDEFMRIKGLHHEVTPHNLEVVGLCDRAVTNTKQRIPIIEQRDKAERSLIRVKNAIRELSERIESV